MTSKISEELNDYRRKLLHDSLQQGKVLILVDTSIEGVELPNYLLQLPRVQLSLSYRFGHPLELQADGIVGELSFNRTVHSFKIPWDALIAFRDSQRNLRVFTDDPDETAPKNFQIVRNMLRTQPKNTDTSESETVVLLDRTNEIPDWEDLISLQLHQHSMLVH